MGKFASLVNDCECPECCDMRGKLLAIQKSVQDLLEELKKSGDIENKEVIITLGFIEDILYIFDVNNAYENLRLTHAATSTAGFLEFIRALDDGFRSYDIFRGALHEFIESVKARVIVGSGADAIGEILQGLDSDKKDIH